MFYASKNPLGFGQCVATLIQLLTGGGIIRSWDALYRSEGATQVAFLMIKYLMKLLKGGVIKKG